MSKEDKGIIAIYILTIIKNAVAMVCFTVLAIVFNKWWISLFSALFWSSLKFKSEESNNEWRRVYGM